MPDISPRPIGGLEAVQSLVPLSSRPTKLVFIEARIEADGSISWAEVVQSTDDEASADALDAFLDVSFTPGYQDARPIASTGVWPVWVSSCPPLNDFEFDIFDVRKYPPTLIGGLQDLQYRLRYPDDARRDGVEGQVNVQFVVDEIGNARDLEVLRSPDGRLNEAALEVVRESQFTPAHMRCRPVRVRFALPVTFRLQ